MRKKISHTIVVSTLLFVGLATLSSFSSYSITIGGLEGSLTNVKKSKYRKDATRLALRLISKNKEYQNLEAKVPDQLVTSIYNALIAVHSSTIEKAIEVTQLHKLHTFPVPSVDNFLVVYRRDADWAKPLRLGDLSTTNPTINTLCEQYSLKISSNVEWDDEHNSISVRADESLNIAPIANDFKSVEGISEVDMLVPNGDGNDIEIFEKDNKWEIHYIIKFDNCFSGCKQRHSWVFEVDKANSGVNFVQEAGNELPEWMKKSIAK